jgi:hypothetical protein
MLDLFGAIKRAWLRYSGQPVVTVLRDAGRWRQVSRAYRARHPRCALCHRDKNIEAHHIVPWHKSAELRYDDNNLISLCRDDHFKFGHFNNWKLSNPGISALAAFVQVQRNKYR